MDDWRKMLMGAGALVVIVAVAALAMCERNPTIEEVVEELGFTALVPASTLLPPGTLVYRDAVDPRRYGILCPPEASLGTEFEPRTSEVPEVSQKLSQEFDLSASVKGLLQSSFPMISNGRLTLSRPVVYMISVDQIYEHIDKMSPACAKAFRRFKHSGTPISMIMSVIQADVDYVLEFDTDFDVGADPAVLRAIGDSLGARYGSRSGTTLQGDSLFWGFQDLQDVEFFNEDTGTREVVSIAEFPEAVARIRDSMSVAVADTAWGRADTNIVRAGLDTTAVVGGTRPAIRIIAGEGLIPRDRPLRTIGARGGNQ